jgi:D-lyxose ketol-isomerase
MITRKQYEQAVERAVGMMAQVGLVIPAEERARFEAIDFGLGELEKTGVEFLTYVNTDRVCARDLVMFPHQTCPEHRHPTRGSKRGKEETFRCRMGTVYLYVPGTPAENPSVRPPHGCEAHYKVRHEICLRPGKQYTLMPDTPHWFQAGPEGAIVSEFSTRSTDQEDIFTDPRVRRVERAPEIVKD